MFHSYPTCDLRANCSQSSWDWPVLLHGCPADSVAIHPCNISHLPSFALESLGSRSLELPHCSSTTFQWQSLFTPTSQHVDISNCPLVCSCETVWVNSQFEHLHVRPPRQFQCSPLCPPAQLTRQDIGEPVLGQSFQLEYRVTGQILPTINKTRRYFKWQGSRRGHSHRELISEKVLRLEIVNVTENDLGVINVVCWHCVQPLFVYFQVRIPTPLSLHVETSDASSFRLAVQGYPIDQISLMVIDAKGENMTSNLFSTSSTKFWNTMVVRPDPAHSLFHRRIFNIFTTSCTDCPEDHLTGDYTFIFCAQETRLDSNSTGECKSISHHFNRFNASDPVHIQPSYEHRISLEPVFIVLLIFLTLFMAAAFINAKLHNIKSVGWRKWRWSFHSRLSRRTSHATEETMLRLEERLSMSSSDYTGHVIPCIKGGAVQIHEQIGKGAFGAVYCGTWEQTGPRSVAVKALVEADAEVEKEATVLCRLDHENIVRLYGLTRDGDRLLLVFEIMRLGDLRSYLKTRAPQPGSYASFPAALDQSELKFIVRQVARGLCYLVAQQIVHRDLAARNCLVDGESDQMCGNPKQRPSISVKISDFGMSRRLSYNSDYYRMQNQSLLPVRWLPPEAISDHRFSSKSDIWSLGVTMWEIFSYGGVPFDTLSNHEVVSYALAGMRPPKPVSCPNDVYSLMERCWALDPEQRLTAEDVFLDPAVAEPLEVGPL